MSALQTLIPLDRGFSSPAIPHKATGSPERAESYFYGNAGLRKQLDAFLQLIQEKDVSLYQHSRRVQHLARHLAQKLALAASETKIIEQAALFHDLGKILIDDAVLQKTSSLTQKEFEQMKQHPAYGAMLLRQIGASKEVVALVYHHHERWDGCGYPTRLRGEAIPLGARIIGIADAFDAMTASRPYSARRTEEQALAELRRCAGTQFDPTLTDLFCRGMQSKFFRTQAAYAL
jgi:putative nucleotidyltransferase with HDIG domain